VDSGSGIDPDIKLFEEFEKTGKMNNAFGAGLGLSIVKELTSLLGIQIKYKRNDLKGLSKFYFYIPLEIGVQGIELGQKCRSQVFSDQFMSSVSISSDDSKCTVIQNDCFVLPVGMRIPALVALTDVDIQLISRKRIIIVDDEKLVRESEMRMLKTFFHDKGVDVELHEASDGLECLHLVYALLNEGKSIECILMDETMKYLCGSLCSSFINSLVDLRVIPKIPIYLVTAYMDKFADEDITAKGIKSIISKPLSMSKLSDIFN